MNARALTDRGAALLVRDDKAVEELGSTIIGLLDDRTKLDQLRLQIAGMGLHNAADAIAAEVIRLARH